MRTRATSVLALHLPRRARARAHEQGVFFAEIHGSARHSHALKCVVGGTVLMRAVRQASPVNPAGCCSLPVSSCDRTPARLTVFGSCASTRLFSASPSLADSQRAVDARGTVCSPTCVPWVLPQWQASRAIQQRASGEVVSLRTAMAPMAALPSATPPRLTIW